MLDTTEIVLTKHFIEQYRARIGLATKTNMRKRIRKAHVASKSDRRQIGIEWKQATGREMRYEEKRILYVDSGAVFLIVVLGAGRFRATTCWAFKKKTKKELAMVAVDAGSIPVRGT